MDREFEKSVEISTRVHVRDCVWGLAKVCAMHTCLAGTFL